MTTLTLGGKTRFRPAVRWVRAVIAAGLLAHVIVGAVCMISPSGHVGDFRRYRELATTPGRPYVDYPAEYPPGALLLFTGVARVTDTAEQFNATLIVLNVAADAVIISILWSSWGAEAAAVFIVSTIPVLSLLLFRMDLWSAAAASVAVASWARDRRTLSAGALCAGAALKLWPLPFGVLFLARGRTRWTAEPLAVFVAATALGLAMWVWFSGWNGVMQVFTFRGATGWDIESVAGSVWKAIDPASLRMESGALRVGVSGPAVSVALFLMSSMPALWALWKGASIERFGTAWVGGMGAVLSCSALLSPQFLAWLLPGAAIAWAEDDRRTAWLVALLVVTTVTYRILHTQSMPELVIVRNAILVGTTLQALNGLRLRRTGA